MTIITIPAVRGERYSPGLRRGELGIENLIFTCLYESLSV
jgi:hypothetical protein